MSDSKQTLFRVVHNKNYTTINNHICKDKRISYKAKGIWLYAFSRPDDWQFYESDIINQSNDGKYAIKAGLKELEQTGYLVKEKRKDEKNRFVGWSYFFYEIPTEIKEMFPKREKPNVGKVRSREKQPLLSTNLLPSTEEQQQEPTGYVAAFHELLIKTELSHKDKTSLINYALKNNLTQEEFANAISFVLRPEFVVQKTLVQAIMWAMKDKPDLPVPVDQEKNKKLAESAEYILHSIHWNIEALNDKVFIYSKTPNNVKTYEIKYCDPNFKNNLNNLLEENKFTKAW